jgi:shikimate kinase
MRGVAGCRGAVTIVNAIATGKGAAFGVDLQTDVVVELRQDADDVSLDGEHEGLELAAGCVRSAAMMTGFGRTGALVKVRSEIPISRGLKSSSAASNAFVLAAVRAAGGDVDDATVLDLAIDESVKAGVTITGAFDDATACFAGGAAVTDNRTRTILSRGRVDPSLVVVIHVPERSISKSSLKGKDFGHISRKVDEAFDLAMKGEYLRAMELNSAAYAAVLGVSEDAVHAARKAGALAAGISGTGPATAAVARKAEADRVVEALSRLDGKVIVTSPNDVPAREVVPRLL